MNQDDNQVPQILENWEIFRCNVDNMPATIRLNLGLEMVAPIDKYTKVVCLRVKVEEVDEYGFPQKEEFKRLYQIEDDITAQLEEYRYIMAGVVISDGSFDIYFYATDEINEEFIENKLITSISLPFNYYFQIDEDKNWDLYYNFLYPDEYAYQHIQNQRVIRNLEKNGDNLEIKRYIDHFIYFENEKDRDNYAQKVEDLGYTIKNKHNPDKENNSYSLQIIKLDSPINIDKSTWELKELAKEYNADYDGWGCPIANDEK